MKTAHGRPFGKCWSLFAAAAIGCALLQDRALADADRNLLDLSIEELLHVEITSASKKTQRISDTAAAAFVITRDDIKRSGARSIPEALRMAPGLEVAQIDANKWAISARGFNGRFANKLLVLMDGRALYTPSFGGVFWDVQDTVMEDIERIEVIRGPGGTLWGANAVNGVINIITRSAGETRGGELIASAANGPTRWGSMRFGDTAGGALDYRFYGKYTDEAGNEDLAGHGTADGWSQGRVGFRADWSPTAQNVVSLTTEAYDGSSGETLARALVLPPYSEIANASEKVSGFFTVVDWRHQYEQGCDLQAKGYIDHTHRAGVLFGEDRDSAVLDLQYHFPLASRQDVVTGAGFRYNAYRFSATADVSVTPQSPSNLGYNAFVQDEIQVVQNRLSLTAGVDFEHNPLSPQSIDTLPSGRLLWTLNAQNHIWAAVTKAISTPTYEDTGASVRNASPVIPAGVVANPFPVPIVTSVVSNPAIGSEKLVAYELGYRAQIARNVTLDATLYRHDYEDLRDAVTTGVDCEPSLTPVAVNPACVIGAVDVVDQIQFQNVIRGHSTGAEVAADWAPADTLRLRATYTYLHMALEPRITDPTVLIDIQALQGASPKNQFSLRADVALTPLLDWDLAMRHVDTLVAIPVPQYWSADTNLVWRAAPRLELSIVGTNLLQKAHLEFVSELADVVPTAIERTIAAKFRWLF